LGRFNPNGSEDGWRFVFSSYGLECAGFAAKNFGPVSAWIPSQLCSKLDLFALKCKLTRREALEIVLCSILNEKNFLFELEITLMTDVIERKRESRF
jgi:hypothetical protein